METTTRGQPNRMREQLPPALNPPPVGPAFGKCFKNHAAIAGGYALDGCLAFMATPTSTPTDPTSLRCDACGCHRNFHLHEVAEKQSPVERVEAIEYPYWPQHAQYHHYPPTPTPSRQVPMANNNGTLDSPSPNPISSSYYPTPPHMFFAFNPGFAAVPESADRNRASILTAGSMRKKRFRSKFSQDQKVKMQEFAERIGWKMLKKENEMIVRFCSQIGVDKGVFKVWMHNHKNISITNNNLRNRCENGSNA